MKAESDYICTSSNAEKIVRAVPDDRDHPAVPAGQLLPRPANVTLRDAAALPEVACTVWSNVGELAHLPFIVR